MLEDIKESEEIKIMFSRKEAADVQYYADRHGLTLDQLSGELLSDGLVQLARRAAGGMVSPAKVLPFRRG